MLQGPNLEATRALAEAVGLPVIASGGVSSLKDIENLLAIEQYGVTGVITGKAIYSGALNLREAVELTRRRRGNS
jgi:phosphoribosylformimino-5-aminoimidazole carboxamide ribotide isomerase